MNSNALAGDDSPAYDVVTIGECMLRFSPQNGEMLEQADQMYVDPAGSESNMAAALSRLGVRVAWVSALPDTQVGRWITTRLETHGVDVSHVVWTDERVGVFFYEPGTPPRGSRVVYDRADSAMSRLMPEQVDWPVVTDTRLMHLSGITPALSASCRDLTVRAMTETKLRGGRTSMDVNYRAKLWSPEQASSTLSPILEEVDILISTEADIRLLYNIEAPVEVMITQLRERFDCRTVVVTLATGGAVGWSEETGTLRTGPHPVEQVDRLGAGDAFDAGLLYGLLRDDLQMGLSCASALAALSYSEQGDMTWSTADEVMSLAAQTLE